MIADILAHLLVILLILLIVTSVYLMGYLDALSESGDLFGFIKEEWAEHKRRKKGLDVSPMGKDESI